MTKTKKYILQKERIEKKIDRLAFEIVENNIEEKELVFVGIAKSGVILAEKLKRLVEKFSSIKVKLLTLKLDKSCPTDVTLSENMDFSKKSILIIDDVTNSGKTLLYATKPFLAYHPKKIQTLVLVERTHTQFPINANYKGFSLATTMQEHIIVEVNETEITGAYLS